MDIRSYFQRMRDIERGISSTSAIVVSQSTADGGRAGVMNEVARETAAQLIVDGRARLATDEEVAEYRNEIDRERQAAERAAMASKVQIAFVSDQELRQLKAVRPQKG